jgi:hypothetical protein
MTTPGPNAAQIPIPENAETMVMTPRELALYHAGEAMGQVKALRGAATFLGELAKKILDDPSAGQLAALLSEGADKSRACAFSERMTEAARADAKLGAQPVEPIPAPLNWSEMANMLEQVKGHPIVLAKQAAEVLTNGARQLLQQAVQGDHVFAAKLAEVSGLTKEQIKAKPSLLGAAARALLAELAKR